MNANVRNFVKKKLKQKPKGELHKQDIVPLFVFSGYAFDATGMRFHGELGNPVPGAPEAYPVYLFAIDEIRKAGIWDDIVELSSQKRSQGLQRRSCDAQFKTKDGICWLIVDQCTKGVLLSVIGPMRQDNALASHPNSMSLYITGNITDREAFFISMLKILGLIHPATQPRDIANSQNIASNQP
jgi:hypothetical protein